MGKPTILKVTSLSEYAAAVERLLLEAKTRSSASNVANWYRGHSMSRSHTLKPSLYRHPTVKVINALLDLESEMMASFRRQGMLHSFQPTGDDQSSSMMQLFYMQHHGVPTRLLDWTSNPFIALYFALADARPLKSGKYPEAAAVWVLDPFSWNRHALGDLSWGDRGPADSNDPKVKSYQPLATYSAQNVKDMYSHPISLIGAANTQRMLAQKGVFTIFGQDVRPMEVIYEKEAFPPESLVKLEVPADSIAQMLGVLISVGYTDSVAYPDLQGLAMEIKRLNGFQS